MNRIVVSPEEACQILKLGHDRLYKYLEDGEVPAYKDGKSWKIPVKCLEAWAIDRAIAESEHRKSIKTNVYEEED